MTYIVVGILLVAMLCYIIFRKAVWLKQITRSGRIVYVCSNCELVWTPVYYSEYPLEYPPKECPQCHRKMQVR